MLPFGEQQWATVQKAASNRRKKRNFENSVSRDVILDLPESPGEKDGYHVSCYKNFTAVSASQSPVDIGDTARTSTTTHLHSATATSDEKPSTSGIFPPQCLFCGNTKKRKKGGLEVAGACETLEASQSIQEAALVLNDAKILSKISVIDLVTKEVKYHHSRKSSFLMSANRVRDRDRKSAESPSTSTTNPSAVDDIQAYVEQSVLRNKRPELLTSVYARYLDLCNISSETPLNNAQSLMRNLKGKFGDKLKFQTPLGKKLGLIMYSSEMSDDAVRVAYDYASDDEQIVTKATLLLRKQLLDVQKKDLPENPTLDDLKGGDVSPPPLLSTFFTTLYCGQNPTKCTDHVMRHVKSSCDDALFITRRGKVKPAKQVALGVAVKSVTGSKKVVQVLNRFGHCINYNSLEELETETAEQLQERRLSCPDGTIKDKPMGVAFDNFDELTNTFSGADMPHDTMGIMYQNVTDESEETRSVEPSESVSLLPIVPSTRTGRKRSLEQQEVSLEPHCKKPKMTVFSYKHVDVFNLPDVSGAARNLDLMWMMSHALDVGKVPMWVGYNAKNYEDKLPKQEVRYMPNLRQPIASLDVIQETLITAQRCAKECEQKFGIVTYDLNAAKPAMQIQATEKPQFDDVFIMPGVFHIERHFLKRSGRSSLIQEDLTF